MEIAEKKENTVNVIALVGRLDAYAAGEVEKKFSQFVNIPQVSLVINMEKLEYISSSGLRVLLAALKAVKKQQGDVRLACLQPYVREVFDMAGFTQLFQMFEKEEDAIKSYK